MNTLLLSAWREVATHGSSEVRLDRASLSELVDYATDAARRVDELATLLHGAGQVLARCAEGRDGFGEAEMAARAIAEVLR